MEFVIISNSLSKTRKVFIGRFWISTIVILAISVFATAFYAGSNYSKAYLNDTATLKYQEVKKVQLAEIKKQQQQVENTILDAQENLDVLAARLSKLQGHIMRLDALGSRIADMANLDDIEFDVTEPPGMGGAQNIDFNSSIGVSDFLLQLEHLESQIRDRSDKLTAIESMLMNYDLQEKTLPEGRPVQGGWISSLFGWRNDPITGKREFHGGIDFASKPKSFVKSVGAGIITWSGRRSGYGNMIEINHGNGYVTRYAHNKENLVIVGDKVEKGQEIAVIGSTGRSTGTHVHLEVLYNGVHVDPKKYISIN